MAIASKTALVFPVVIYVMYKVLKNRSLKSSFTFIGMGLLIAMFVTLMLDFNAITALFWMRTIGNSGSLTLHYHYFLKLIRTLIIVTSISLIFLANLILFRKRPWTSCWKLLLGR
jgi:hypothetical protein